MHTSFFRDKDKSKPFYLSMSERILFGTRRMAAKKMFNNLRLGPDANDEEPWPVRQSSLCITTPSAATKYHKLFNPITRWPRAGRGHAVMASELVEGRCDLPEA